MRLLTSRSGWKLPVVFLTNGGGVTERAKATELTELLRIPTEVHESQVILAHTPFRTLQKRTNSTRLVVGKGSTLDVARSYWQDGDGTLVTTSDVIRSAGPSMVPFSAHVDVLFPKKMPKKMPTMPTMPKTPPGSAGHRIDEIYVFTDPAGDDWYNDLQVVLDTLLRNGAPVCGGGDGHQETQQPKLFISQRDLLFSNGFHSSRLGLGAWVRCLETLYKEITGSELSYEVFGKPEPEVYRLAETSLREQRDRLGWGPEESLRVMAVGDNAGVDIRGANRAGWLSSLVLTGVASPTDDGDDDGEDDALCWDEVPTYRHTNVLEVIQSHAFQ